MGGEGPKLPEARHYSVRLSGADCYGCDAGDGR